MRTHTASIVSHYVVVPNDNVDTDQIISARFLKTTGREGLGPFAFYDWRYHADGSPKREFPLNAPGADGARILVAGRNFGCGSSREHAVWALLGAGFQAVISADFADIFRGNALTNGLLPVQLDAGAVQQLMNAAHGKLHGPQTLTIDLDAQSVTDSGPFKARFDIPPFAKHCLMRGIDELDFLLQAESGISEFERLRVET